MPHPTTALVLAGGRGERLWPLTSDRPKPMVLLNGRPILEHHLEWLRANGIERAYLLTGYLHEVIADHFAATPMSGLDIHCIVEETPLGRGGAFRNAYRRGRVRRPTRHRHERRRPHQPAPGRADGDAPRN